MQERIVSNIEGQLVTVTHVNRIIYPQLGLVKAQVIEYYLSVANYMLPHLEDRPLVFTRFPDGVEQAGFYQKKAPSYLPDWMSTVEIDPGKEYIMAHNKASMAWLANQACIEVHPWLSRKASLNNPDFMVFDLDPSPANSFDQVVVTALELHRLLNTLNLESYLKTSGGSGLHIYIPILPLYTYNQIRQLALQIAGVLVKILPELTTVQRSIAKRGDRIYIDCLQIGQGKTLCAPYSLRPTPLATVSTPIHWDEVTDIHPQDFTIASVIKRIAEIGDLFLPVLSKPQDLGQAFKANTYNLSYQ